MTLTTPELITYSLHENLVAAVAKWSRYRIVAGFVTSSSPVPLKTRHVFRELEGPPVGVVGELGEGGANSGVVHVTLP
ncbi:hypothetical protein TNCV_3661591 [Trichonephila clavipes]|nr:hypothetical protein TNCV_3661591 [Trichonephila clavipes]